MITCTQFGRSRIKGALKHICLPQTYLMLVADFVFVFQCLCEGILPGPVQERKCGDDTR